MSCTTEVEREILQQLISEERALVVVSTRKQAIDNPALH